MTCAIKTINNVVVLDLECTAWKGSVERNWTGPDEEPEIIQIGAVVITNKNNGWSIGPTFMEYVKPTIQPTLSGYIRTLTGINQHIIDCEGLHFNKALKRFTEFCPTDAVLTANGPDWQLLDRNCAINKIVNPISRVNFRNLRPYISKKLGLLSNDERLNSYQLYKVFDGEPGSAHDALSDALNVARAAIRLHILETIAMEFDIPQSQN
ncbi:uncharacterized protein METZ01_LOCUS467306 [marine metagenome]|uniref:Exonuclease domain-containing protein n=1 Tax=marine metagenome TaxID=408172 RepID=A0A383B3A2_9ZZZZ